MANIRIKDQTTDTALVAGDYVIVDNATEGTRKFDLGQKLADIDDDITDVKQDLQKINGVPNTVRSAIYALLNSAGYENTGLADEMAIVQEWANTHATAIALSENSIGIDGIGTHQLNAIITPSDSTDTPYWTSSDTNVAVVSQTGLVTAVDNGSCTITASVGTLSASCIVTVANVPTIMYTISNTLRNCTTSNDAESIQRNDEYTAILSLTGDFEELLVSVTMNNIDITDAVYDDETGTINISSVTGNLSITATGIIDLMTPISGWGKTWNGTFTGTTDGLYCKCTDNMQWDNVHQIGLTRRADLLNGKTIHFEADVESVVNFTSGEGFFITVAETTTANPTSGNQRAGKTDPTHLNTVGHMSEDVEITFTASSSNYIGLWFFMNANANNERTVSNVRAYLI